MNGTPVLVCLEEQMDGSYQHVGKFIMTSNGQIVGIIAGKFAFDCPRVLYWTHLGQDPWHMGLVDLRKKPSSVTM